MALALPAQRAHARVVSDCRNQVHHRKPRAWRRLPGRHIVAEAARCNAGAEFRALMDAPVPAARQLVDAVAKHRISQPQLAGRSKASERAVNAGTDKTQVQG